MFGEVINMKKYLKPELSILNLSVSDELAALNFQETNPGAGGIPVSVYDITSFDEPS